jgi:hypothetical protein
LNRVCAGCVTQELIRDEVKFEGFFARSINQESEGGSLTSRVRKVYLILIDLKERPKAIGPS